MIKYKRHKLSAPEHDEYLMRDIEMIWNKYRDDQTKFFKETDKLLWSKYDVCEKPYESEDCGIMVRMTYPLYLVVIVIYLVVVGPIKWLITGSMYVNLDNKLVNMLHKWGEKLR